MGRDRAAYMREYRARRRGLTRQHEGEHIAQPCYVRGHDTCDIQALEEEIRHLKAELAKRPPIGGIRPFNTRPFTPVPKK